MKRYGVLFFSLLLVGNLGAVGKSAGGIARHQHDEQQWRKYSERMTQDQIDKVLWDLISGNYSDQDIQMVMKRLFSYDRNWEVLQYNLQQKKEKERQAWERSRQALRQGGSIGGPGSRVGQAFQQQRAQTENGGTSHALFELEADNWD